MKRHPHLFERVASFGSLHAAWLRVRRGRRRHPLVLRFEHDLEARLLDLERRLQDGTWRPGTFRTFTVREPRVRTISAAPLEDRVVHHALVGVVEPHFERIFDPDSCACRKGRGTHRAADRFQRHSRRHAYVLQLDIRKFFATVDHRIVLEQLARRVSDERILALFGEILASFRSEEPPGFFEGDDLFTPGERRRGLPVGNLPSQFLANVILDPIDRLVRDLGFPHVRYCDDLALFADDTHRLRTAWKSVEDALDGLRLRLHPLKCRIVPTRCGPEFVGYRIWPHRRRLRRDNVRAFRRRLVLYRAAVMRGDMSLGAATARVRSWIAHARHANTARLRELVFLQTPIVG